MGGAVCVQHTDKGAAAMCTRRTHSRGPSGWWRAVPHTSQNEPSSILSIVWAPLLHPQLYQRSSRPLGAPAASSRDDQAEEAVAAPSTSAVCHARCKRSADTAAASALYPFVLQTRAGQHAPHVEGLFEALRCLDHQMALPQYTHDVYSGLQCGTRVVARLMASPGLPPPPARRGGISKWSRVMGA